MSSFSRNKNEREPEEEALCFEDTQILTSEYAVGVGSQRRARNAKRWKEALPRELHRDTGGVVGRVVRAGPVLAGLELMTQCSVKAKKNTCAQYIS